MDDVFGVESGVYVAIRAVLATCSVMLIGALALRVLVLPRYAGPDADALRQRVDLTLPSWIDVLGMRGCSRDARAPRRAARGRVRD